MVDVNCKTCNKIFYAKPFWVKKGFGKYCSPACQHLGRRNGRDVKCDTCGKEFYRNKHLLDLSESGKYFCGKTCQAKWRNQQFIGEKHANWKNGLYAYRSVMNRHKVPEICRLCGTTDSRVLAVHHIDKNRKNNIIGNLAWLCQNCHFLVHHDKLEYVRFMELVV